ncbi:MAG: RagB/SusD family nutrient uptake outer membrane protein, partial [Bacteroidales bacterium]
MKTLNIKSLCIIMLLLLLSLGVENCKKSWLEPKPLSIFTPENAFVDSRGLYGAISACDQEGRAEFYELTAPIITELTFSDAAVNGIDDRPGPPQNLNIQMTPTAELNGDNNKMKWYWDHAFKIIKYANVVISRIDEATFTSTAERNAVLGMAYFHRSMEYYRLTQQFGDVPFIGREITEPKLDFYSTQREVILKKIKKDMEFAAHWCSDNVDRGRVTKGACQHLLTKICLSLGDFDDALAYSDSLINGGVYHLMTTPFGDIPKEEGDWLWRAQGVVRDDIMSRLHWQANKAIAANKETLLLAISNENLVDSRLDLRVMYN